MKWINLAERQPDELSNKVFRYIDDKYVIPSHYITLKGKMAYIKSDEGYEWEDSFIYIEWLDESPELHSAEDLAEESVLIQNELENLTIEWLSDRKESLYITQGEDTIVDGTVVFRRIILEREQIAKFCEIVLKYT